MHHCSINGTIVPSHQAQMGIYDLAFLRGYGLFDYFRTYNGRVFQWELYWKRFENSAFSLGLELPGQKDHIYDQVCHLISLQGTEECAVRFLLTGGYTEDSVSATKPNFLIMTEDIHAAKPEDYVQGIKVLPYKYVRDLPHVKSIDYKHFMIAQPAIKAAGASDVLFHKNGFISELSRSNVFYFDGENLITPSENILNGITKQVVSQLATKHFNLVERPVTIEEFLHAEEIFTTSTTKKIVPITQIGSKTIGSGTIGPKTALLLGEINNLVQNW